LLAWVRTGIAIIGVGLVVSRFGLFLHFAGASHGEAKGIDQQGAVASGVLGVIFVLVGSAAILISAIQHHRFLRTLSGPDLPPAYSRMVSVVLAMLVSALGIALAAYLLATQPRLDPERGTLESGSLESGSLESGTLESGTLESGTLESGSRRVVSPAGWVEISRPLGRVPRSV
jgi:putative membrane protein